jgi:hypothetical protein
VQYQGDVTFPHYQACSDECADGLQNLILLGHGVVPMGDYTEMEKKAVAATRVVLWDELVAVGKVRIDIREMPDDLPGGQIEDIAVSTIFAELNERQIDRIISAVWDGLRASMQKQSAMGGMPF